jgi:hypothetical protein
LRWWLWRWSGCRVSRYPFLVLESTRSKFSIASGFPSLSLFVCYTTLVVVGWLVYLFIWYPNVLVSCFPSQARFPRFRYLCATLIRCGGLAGLFISLVPECTRYSFSLASVFLSLSLFLCHIPLIVVMDGWLINFWFSHLLAPCFRLRACFYRSRYFCATFH